jgi:hypothetical protein
MSYFSPSSVSGLNGFLDSLGQKAIAGLITKVEFYSTLSQPSTIATDKSITDSFFPPPGKEGEVVDPGPPPAPGVGAKLLSAVKPTFEFNSPVFGKKFYAPYGVAGRDEYKTGKVKAVVGLTAVVLGLMAAGFAIGYARGKKV